MIVRSKHPTVTRLKTGLLPPLNVFSMKLANNELLEPKNVVEAFSILQ